MPKAMKGLLVKYSKQLLKEAFLHRRGDKNLSTPGRWAVVTSSRDLNSSHHYFRFASSFILILRS